ncbi:VCBS domain-containing protein [Mesorhizobium sp. M8A.F.Ca.ET.161.01.1.1]|uniref:beta strand repeat-containing protein n=3 Tax=Mesorhizobium TaxID=68287 RepID=UPI001093C94E|nr:VCBS domain-containing protein [Mesorhizobium sp. M8A.F.Ca.ET.161.01.1.1]TGT83181.1 adhesin [Mesorhizobium sp. M8A.F.Ca.ET.161.01.1.1]
MATQVTGAGGTTTSFSNTPQANNDVFNLNEDTVVLASGSQTIIVLDVMANDQGGNAKSLFSVDDGISASTATKQYAPIDLTTQDVQATGISAWESIGGGVSIRINNGKVEMDLSVYLAAHGFASLQAMGAGDQINETFTYAIKLGNGTLSWASVSVNIQGTNDGAIITAAPGADLTVVEAGGVANGTLNDPNAHGQLIITDPDVGQDHFQAPPSLQGTYGTFTFNTTTGVWAYTLNQTLADPLTQGQHVTDTLTVKSADGSASYNIVVNIAGTNDAAVLSTDVRNLTEGNTPAAISTSGTLTISDVDSPATFVAQAATVGTYGSFSIDSAGAWTYTASSAHNEFAAGTTYTDTFDVVSADGTHTSVTINIDGTNDAAILSADVRNLTETNSATDISSSGTLTISDVDSPATFVAQAGTVGTYGSFSIDSAGAWTYTASSAHNEFAAGTTYTDTFDVVSADGTHTSVTINIDGTNDAAILSADVRNLTETNSATDISSSGTLTISDVDSPATFVAQAGTVGTYGSFSIDSAGAWTYTASSAHNEFAAGQHYTENFNVVSADGTPTSVHIDILGTNDAPTVDLNGALAGTSTSLSYTAGSAATAIAPTGTVADVDSADFNGGSLTVSFTANGTSADQLTIQNQGTGAGQIGVSGSNVTYGGTTIGTFTGGTNGTNLVITFNASATQAAAQALEDHIRYSNATSATTTKTVTYTLVDGDGTASGGTDTGTATATINVTGGDTTAPTVVISHDNNGAKQTITFTFSEAVSGFDINDIALVGATATAGTFIHVGIDGTGHDIYTLDVTKPVGGGAHTVQVLSSGTGTSFWTDIAGNPGIGTPAFNLPAGTSGEPINLALTDPSHEGALITVTVKDVPSGWTIDGATQNADGSWTVQTNDLHGLTVTTPADFTGAAVLDVQMTWINADGTLGSASIADNVEAYAPGSPIFAWSGDDVLTGSHGNDLFVFSQPIGADTVHNFDAAADQIDLIGYSGLADFADLQTHIADDANGNAVIALGDGQSITLDGVHSGALTASNFVFDQTPVVNNSGTMTIGDGALLPLSGIINNSGLISLDSTGSDTLLQVIQHGVTLQGGGQILLSDSAANMISGTGPNVTLVNVDNTISGAGQLGGGMLSLDNRGTIIASGSNALVIDTGGSVVTNSGTLEATGSGGLTITGGLANSGMLWANGGDIVIHGQVTGDGDATIGNLSKLEFGGASSTDVTFGHDAAGTLQLDDSFDYSGRIGGITNDDRLDLGDILFGAGTTAVYQANQDGSGGTLTVSDGTHGAALHLVGSYDANAFKLADDGQGHTVVSYNPAEFTLTGIGSGAISSDLVV